MTVDVALTIASKRAVDLWRISHDHGGGSPDSLRETALDILTCEAERLLAVLAAARLVANEEHDRRVNDCLDLHVMTKERDALREQLAEAHDQCVLAYGTNEKLREQVAEREDAAFRAGYGTAFDGTSAERSYQECEYEALAAWQARQKGTP